MSTSALERTVVAWNRSRLDLRSDEVQLYALAAADASLRRRILAVIRRVPLPYPAFWRAALASLGETVDWTVPVPRDDSIA